MRKSLQQRIADNLEPEPARSEEQARLVEDFARILRETAAVAAATRPGGPSEDAPGRTTQFPLPQILQPRPIAPRENKQPARSWLITLPLAAWDLVASAPLTTAMAIIGAVVITLVWQGETAKPAASARTPAETRRQEARASDGARMSIQAVRTVPFEGSVARDSRDPAAAVAAAERLLATGQVLAAREVLGAAAVAGDTAARFALAETFDPNVLASRDLRGATADPVTAKLLYEQARSAGEPRAAQRLRALRSE